VRLPSNSHQKLPSAINFHCSEDFGQASSSIKDAEQNERHQLIRQFQLSLYLRAEYRHHTRRCRTASAHKCVPPKDRFESTGPCHFRTIREGHSIRCVSHHVNSDEDFRGHGTNGDTDSMHYRSLKSIRSKSASTLHGKPLTQHTGLRMAMLLFVVMKQESDNLPDVSTRFRARQSRHFMQLSNGLLTKHGRQARLACLVSATTGPPSGELQHGIQKASRLSVPGRVLRTTIAILLGMEVSSQMPLSIHGGINKSCQTNTAGLAEQRAGGAKIRSRAISQMRSSLTTKSISWMGPKPLNFETATVTLSESST
jgi:hypothetical protein